MMNADSSPFDTSMYDLAEMPFEIREHAFIKEQVYIQKWAIRQRLTKMDPRWYQTRPIVTMMDEHDIATATISIVVNGVERFGTGVGIIQRKDSKGNDYSGFALARSIAKAVKSAVSDALPRAALEFNIGWYLRLLSAKTIRNEESLKKFIAEEIPKAMGQLRSPNGPPPSRQSASPQPPPRQLNTSTGEVQRQPEWYMQNREAFIDGLLKGLAGERDTVERRALDLLSLPDWATFSTGKQAADAVAAAMQPAQPRMSSGKPEAPPITQPQTTIEDPVVTACDDYGMDGASMLKLLGRNSWSTFTTDEQAVAAIHSMALSQELPFITGVLYYGEWTAGGTTFFDFDAPGNISTIRMGGAREKIIGMIGTHGKLFAETYDLSQWSPGNTYHVDNLRVSWKTSKDAKGKPFQSVIGLSWSPPEADSSKDLFDSIPGINDEKEKELEPA